MTDTEAWIVAAARTPVGRIGGALAAIRSDDLAAHAVAAAVQRSGVPAAALEDVVLGCANQAGEDNRDVARMAGLLAGLPEHVGGTTVNRLCGSGLDAVAIAARALMLGDGHAYVAGGVESMSRAPWAVGKPAKSYATGPQTLYDTSLGWRFVNPRMEALGHTDPLGVTAENLVAERYVPSGQPAEAEAAARRYDLSREAQDRFALSSHRKAIAAQQAGRFADELVPVTVAERSGERVVDADEGPRADSSLERLAALKPAFAANGTVTAGNSSSLNDGAAALVLVSSAFARSHGLRPLARIRAVATAGVPPRVMGIGPVPASAKAFTRAGVTLDDVDVIELNEAFAAQALAVMHEWRITADEPRLNPNGGAIALGHPLGCSGARILTTLLYELQRREDAHLGLATMCIGVGQGIAMVVERLS
jgi:acetyl-CoA acetyltransferase family protein